MSAEGAASSANTRGAQAQQWTISFCLLALVLVIARVVTRTLIVKHPGIDDIAIVIAWLFSLGVTITVSFQVKFGLGLHQDTLSASDSISLLKFFWASIWLYHLGLFFTKLALILQYLRIFTLPWFRKVAYGVLAFVVCCSLWTVTGAIFSCVPINAFWSPSPTAHCLPHAVTWYFNAGLNVCTDLLIICLPMPVLKNLKLPIRQRIALMAVFALGGFVCIISFIRIKNLSDVAKSQDTSYANVPAAIWSAIEVDIGIVCACLPSLKATVTRFFPRLFSASTSHGQSNSHSQHNYLHGTNANSTKYGTGHSGRHDMESGAAGGMGTYATIITAKQPVRNESRHNKERRPGRNQQSHELHSYGNTQNYQGTAPHITRPSEGKIDVVTVLEQAVEHRHGGRSPQDSPTHNDGRSDFKDGASDTGSERGLWPPYDDTRDFDTTRSKGRAF